MGHARVTSSIVAFVLLAAACSKKADPPRAAPDASGSPPSPAAEPSVPPAASPPTTAASATPPARAEVVDAGACACKSLYGPVEQPFKGEALLVATAAGVDILTNRQGLPHVTSVPAAGGKPERTPWSGARERTSWPPCAAAGPDVFCADPSGAIARTRNGSTTLVAHSLPGARLAAAPLGGGHSVLAYFAPHASSEGEVRRAMVVFDGRAPEVLSEDGVGASVVTLAPRGTQVLALYLDPRMAMTPAHARVLSWSGPEPTIGKDAVIFVGGTPERRIGAALALAPSGLAFGLIPIAGEDGFGMAVVHIGGEPRDDEPTTWSMYANGLDPAPIAATAGTQPVRVARVRPLLAQPSSPHVLELGTLDEKGAFASQGVVPTSGDVNSLAIAVDAQGALWLLYTDDEGTWLERRKCP